MQISTNYSRYIGFSICDRFLFCFCLLFFFLCFLFVYLEAPFLFSFLSNIQSKLVNIFCRIAVLVRRLLISKNAGDDGCQSEVRAPVRSHTLVRFDSDKGCKQRNLAMRSGGKSLTQQGIAMQLSGAITT